MGSLFVLDELLVVSAAFLLIAELYALGMVYRLRKSLDGAEGSYLLKVVLRFGYAVVATQTLTLINSVLRRNEFVESGDARLVIFLVVEIVLAAAFVRTVWEIHHLPRDGHP